MGAPHTGHPIFSIVELPAGACADLSVAGPPDGTVGRDRQRPVQRGARRSRKAANPSAASADAAFCVAAVLVAAQPRSSRSASVAATARSVAC